jgi:hypothetical protein
MRLLSALICLLLLSACATTRPDGDTEPIIVPQDQVSEFAASEDALREAFVEVLRARGMLVQDGAEGAIVATAPEGQYPPSVTVTFDAGQRQQTRATIDSYFVRYRATSTHHPYQIATEVEAALGQRAPTPYHYPDASYPEPDTRCEVPTDIPSPVPEDMKARVQRVGGQHTILRGLRNTDEARRAGVQGLIPVIFVVDRSGEVVCAHVEDGLPLGLSESALAAVLGAELEPAQLDGSPASMVVRTDLSIRYHRLAGSPLDAATDLLQERRR